MLEIITIHKHTTRIMFTVLTFAVLTLDDASAGQKDARSYSIGNIIQYHINSSVHQLVAEAIKACVYDLKNPDYDNLSMHNQFMQKVKLGSPYDFYMQLIT